MKRHVRQSSPQGSFAASLSRHAGRIESLVEPLEGRIMLGGDHPSFSDFPTSTLIALDAEGEGSATGNITPIGDDDLFRFVMPDDGDATAGETDFVTVLADALTSAGSSLNSKVEVYNASRVLIASGSGNGVLTGGTPTDGWAGFMGTEGQTYFVRVLSDLTVGAGATGTYTIRIDAETSPLDEDVDDVTGEGTVDGSIIRRGDDIVFRVVVPEGDIFDSLATISAIADPTDFDVRVDLYNAQGAFIKGDSLTGNLTNAFTTIKTLGGQTYFVRIRSDEFRNNDEVELGDFTLNVDFAATSVEIDPVIRRGLDEDGGAGADVTSLYSFVAQGTGLSMITLIPLGFPPTDPAVRLYNEAGAQIAFSGDFAGNNAEIQIPLVGGTRYFVVAEGFDSDITSGVGLYIEAHHTYDNNQPVDDHANTPDAGLTILERARLFDLATPLIFGAATPLIDGFGNFIRDHIRVQVANAWGRLHLDDDTDLFSFTTPSDMVSNVPGNDDNAGTQLFLGGLFQNVSSVGPAELETFDANGLAMWDAFDYFPVGFGVEGTVQSLGVWDPDGDGATLGDYLFIGGDFTVTLPDGTILNNLVAWDGEQYLPVETDGPVFAMTTWDQDADGTDFVEELIVGGEFANVAGGPAANLGRVFLAGIDIFGNPIFGGESIGAIANTRPGETATVRALTVWDSPDPDGGDPTVPGLIVGGLFTSAGGTGANNIAQNINGTWSRFGAAGANNGTNGIVHALASYDVPDDDPDSGPQLYVGGQFTAVLDAGGSTAVNNIARWFLVTQDPDVQDWRAVGGNFNGAVKTFATIDLPDGLDANPVVLLIGGEFDNGAFNHIALWDGGMQAINTGFDGPVHALTVFADVDFLVPNNQPVIYAGGLFADADGEVVQNVAKITFDADAGAFVFGALPTGTDDAVLALTAYDMDETGVWDSHDRGRYRARILAGGDSGSFTDTFIRVYDSNLNLIYTNDTIAPPFTDPSGSISPSIAPGFTQEFVLPNLWGGETYYIEVSDQFAGAPTTTGRYQLVVELAAALEDLDGDGIDDDISSIGIEEPDEGDFAGAPELSLSPITGDGTNKLDTIATGSGWFIRQSDVTGRGRLNVEVGDLGQIHDITDTDLFFFRAPANGTMEIRIQTRGLVDEALDLEIDAITGQTLARRTATKTYNSPLDSYLRVFDNDFVQLAASDDNIAIDGEIQTTNVGTFTNRQFTRRDSRIVMNVTAGEVYFVQVESGQRAQFLDDPDLVDWRHAIGSYELLLNTMSDLDFDDDHANAAGGNPQLATVIDINQDPDDPANGTGFITGIIDNTNLNPTDTDLFTFFANVDAVVTVTVTPINGSNLVPFLLIGDAGGNGIAQASAPNSSPITLTFGADQGQRYFIRVDGNGGSEGEYSIEISGMPFVDDYGSQYKWSSAEEILIGDFDFTGRVTLDGSIEGPADTDLFKFTTTDYDFVTVTIDSLDITLDTIVRIFEVSVDPNGNPIFLQIAQNDNGAGLIRDSRVSFSITAPDRTYGPTGNTYNTYFILVSGINPDADSGDYTITLEVTPFDDHPDVDQFDFATPVGIDPAFGQGGIGGEIERSGDSDLLRFEPAGGGPVLITVTADTTFGPRVRVFDQDFNPVTDLTSGLTVVDGPDQAGSSVTYSFDGVRGQTYYILVEGLDGAITTELGTYSVDILTGTADDHANIAEYTLATLFLLSDDTGDGGDVGELLVGRDSDLFTFESIRDGALAITLDANGFTPILRIYDEFQSLLAVITDGGAGDTDGVVNGTIVASLNPSAADIGYFLLVSSDQGEAITTGDYTIGVNGPGLDDGGSGNIDDDHPDIGDFSAVRDPDDRVALAITNADGQTSGVIEDAADEDLFFFRALAGGRAFVQVITPSGSLLDASVTIFDASFNQIAFDTEGVPGANASVSFQTSGANATYYILVDGVGTGTGSYQVKVDTAPETFFLYYPEGFSSANIREYVSLSNPNAFDVTYTVRLRYEDGGPETVIISSGTITAGSRGGHTISDGPNGVAPGVRIGVPYAIVVESTGPLGASLSHYDFGIATGESFTERTSITWTFPRLEKNPGVNDFIVFYNPNATAVTVTLRAYAPGLGVTLVQTVSANSRGGWNVTDTAALPTGIFAITLTSTGGALGIVAALSHYDTIDSAGYGLLGDPTGGTTDGVITSITNGPTVAGEVVFYNPGTTTVSVSLHGSYIRTNLPDVFRTFDIAPRQTVVLDGGDLGLVNDQPLGLRWASTGNISSQFSEVQGGDANATMGATDVGQEFFFGDAFINADFAGVTYLEFLTFYNPADVAIDVDITLDYTDGSTIVTTISVAANDFAELKLHELPEILARGGLNFFSINIVSDSPIAVTMTHYDLFLGGGWSTKGASLGLLNSIASIL